MVLPRNQHELHPEAKDDMLRLLRPLLGWLMPLALRNKLRNLPSVIHNAVLMFSPPPRCGKQSEAGRIEATGEPGW